jgi:hypothetical protein
VLPFNNSPGSEQGHRTPIWDVWIQVLVEGAQKAFGIRRRWGWGQIESGGGGGGGGGGGVAGAAGAAAATAVAGDGGEDVDDGLMLDMMWVVGGVGENVDVIVVGSGGTVVVLMAVKLMVVTMMTMVVLRRLSSDCPSYEKNGGQFPSVREEGEALVLSTVCIFVKAA